MLPRYRVGSDRTTGRMLTGWAHCQQSVAVILSTQLEARLMRLDFGCELIGQIGKNLTELRVLQIYRSVVTAVHRWEPEYRIRRLALESVERVGGLSLRTEGLYYPEGRLGNYAIIETVSGAFVIGAGGIGVAT